MWIWGSASEALSSFPHLIPFALWGTQYPWLRSRGEDVAVAALGFLGDQPRQLLEAAGGLSVTVLGGCSLLGTTISSKEPS